MAKMQWHRCDLCGRESPSVNCPSCGIWTCGGCADTRTFDEPTKCPKCGTFLVPDIVDLIPCANCGCVNQYIRNPRVPDPICVRCGAPYYQVFPIVAGLVKWQAWGSWLMTLLVGVVIGPMLNPKISGELGFVIALVAGFPLTSQMLRNIGLVYPPTRKNGSKLVSCGVFSGV